MPAADSGFDSNMQIWNVCQNVEKTLKNRKKIDRFLLHQHFCHSKFPTK
jgi:hypothetical protein